MDSTQKTRSVSDLACWRHSLVVVATDVIAVGADQQLHGFALRVAARWFAIRRSDYWISFNTACCAWLACCKAAMPVDCRTLYWVIFATVVPMSAF